MRKLPMCTPLIPARKGLQISKEKGECSMWGKGGRERNSLVPHRQHKAYRVKATLPELQQLHEVGVSPPGQRATDRGGGRKRTEHLRMPLLDGSLVIPGIHNSAIFRANKECPYKSSWIL